MQFISELSYVPSVEKALSNEKWIQELEQVADEAAIAHQEELFSQSLETFSDKMTLLFKEKLLQKSSSSKLFDPRIEDITQLFSIFQKAKVETKFSAILEGKEIAAHLPAIFQKKSPDQSNLQFLTQLEKVVAAKEKIKEQIHIFGTDPVKISRKISQLPWSLLYYKDSLGEHLYTKAKGILGKGAFKEVFKAMPLSSSDPLLAYARRKKSDFTPLVEKLKTSTLSRSERRSLKKELKKDYKYYESVINNESSILAKATELQIPYVVHLKACFIHKLSTRFLMELCPDGSLLKEFKLDDPLRVRIGIAVEILTAVALLLKNNIYHLDHKLENILLTKDEKEQLSIRISDFSSGKLLNPKKKNTSVELVSTYPPPEMVANYLNGHLTVLRPPLDLWTLGAVLCLLKHKINIFKMFKLEHTLATIERDNLRLPKEKRKPYDSFLSCVEKMQKYLKTITDPNDAFDVLITQLLSTDPDARPSADEALKVCKKYFSELK